MLKFSSVFICCLTASMLVNACGAIQAIDDRTRRANSAIEKENSQQESTKATTEKNTKSADSFPADGSEQITASPEPTPSPSPTPLELGSFSLQPVEDKVPSMFVLSWEASTNATMYRVTLHMTNDCQSAPSSEMTSLTNSIEIKTALTGDFYVCLRAMIGASEKMAANSPFKVTTVRGIQTIETTNAPSARAYAKSFPMNGGFRIVRGFNGNSNAADGADFDLKTLSFKTLGTLQPIATSPFATVDVRIEPAQIFAAGCGFSGETRTIYEANTRTSRTAPVFTGQATRSDHSVNATAKGLFVWGGFVNQCRVTNSGGIFNPDNNTWAAVSVAPVTGRSHHVAGVFNNKVAIWGGGTCSLFMSCQQQLGDGAVYDLNNNTWTMMPAVQAPSPRSSALSHVQDGKLYVFGGLLGSGGNDTQTLNGGGIYDFANNAWTSIVGGPNVAASEFGSDFFGPGIEAGIGVSNGMLHILDAKPGAAVTYHNYDLVTKVWKTRNYPGSVGRYGQTIQWTGKGFLIFGGSAQRGGGSVNTQQANFIFIEAL